MCVCLWARTRVCRCRHGMPSLLSACWDPKSSPPDCTAGAPIPKSSFQPPSSYIFSSWRTSKLNSSFFKNILCVGMSMPRHVYGGRRITCKAHLVLFPTRGSWAGTQAGRLGGKRFSWMSHLTYLTAHFSAMETELLFYCFFFCTGDWTEYPGTCPAYALPSKLSPRTMNLKFFIWDLFSVLKYKEYTEY